jgi:hypothetical protein
LPFDDVNLQPTEADEMAKDKVPKKMFGAKIPKSLRKSSVLQSLLGSPTGRQIIADALVAAAGAAALALTQSNTGKKAGRAVADSGAIAKDALQSAASAASGVIAGAAKTMLGDHSEHKNRRRH